jgi:hypothetical protein
MTKSKSLSFKKIKKIYHEEVKQPVVEVKDEQPVVLSEPAPIIEEVEVVQEPVEVVQGTEDMVNEFLLAIGAQGLVEVVSTPKKSRVKADASAFVDVSKLDDFLNNIQEEVAAPIVEQAPTPVEVTPLTKQVVDLTKPIVSSNKPKIDPNLKAINDRLGFFEKRLGDLAMRPMGQDPGGGETRLRFLDDVDRSTIVDMRFLRYNATSKKFEFAEVNPHDIVYTTHLVTTSTYTVDSDDYYVGVNYAGPCTITLPTTLLSSGRSLVIKDESGAAETNPITVVGTVDNDAGGFIIQINNGATQLIYRDGWRII